MNLELTQYLPFVAAIATGISITVFLQLAFARWQDIRTRSRRNQLLLAYATESLPVHSVKLKNFIHSRVKFERLGNRFVKGRYQEELLTLLSKVGDSDISKYSTLLRQKGTLTSVAILLGLLLITVSGQSSILLAVILIPLGFFLPDILLKNRVQKRKQQIADLLPDAIDMLQMCVSAGLAFPAALAKVAETQNGPVAEEFARVTSEVQLGQSRVEALRAMAERTQEPHISKFVSSMSQVDAFGIPISNVLQEQSKQMRAVRRERAREKGQKIPIKLLAPIMLCFLPCVMVIILGPAVLSIIRTFPS